MHHLLSLYENLREEVDRVSAAVSELDAKSSVMLMNESLRTKEDMAHTNAALNSMRMQLHWLMSARLQTQPRTAAAAAAAAGVAGPSNNRPRGGGGDNGPSLPLQPTRRLSAKFDKLWEAGQAQIVEGHICMRAPSASIFRQTALEENGDNGNDGVPTELRTQSIEEFVPSTAPDPWKAQIFVDNIKDTITNYGEPRMLNTICKCVISELGRGWLYGLFDEERTGKTIGFELTQEQQNAINFVKESVVKNITTPGDPQQQYFIAMDASVTGAGGVLFQLLGPPVGTTAKLNDENIRSLMFLSLRFLNAES
ncbi:MAG: hypothetical protein M1819_001401 [Sarea resinae]|nr:MAG: hypothetical protein M1819_001401 [Sarea resinae]